MKYIDDMISGYFPSDPRAYLRQELKLRKSRRPQYSLRAFARDLEMSPSFLSEVMNGHQGMSYDRVLWIGKRIKLTPEQIQHLWDLVEAEFGRSEDVRIQARKRASFRSNDHHSRLSVERFKFIADWYHMPLLELMALPDKDFSVVELADILDLTEESVKEALDRLVQLELIKVQKKKGTHCTYEVLDDSTVTGGEGDQEAIRIFHQQTLEAHAAKVEKTDTQERESLSIAFALSQVDWPKFQMELREAVLAVATRYATKTTKNDQVINLTMQAYCMLKPIGKVSK